MVTPTNTYKPHPSQFSRGAGQAAIVGIVKPAFGQISPSYKAIPRETARNAWMIHTNRGNQDSVVGRLALKGLGRRRQAINTGTIS